MSSETTLTFAMEDNQPTLTFDQPGFSATMRVGQKFGDAPEYEKLSRQLGLHSDVKVFDARLLETLLLLARQGDGQLPLELLPGTPGWRRVKTSSVATILSNLIDNRANALLSWSTKELRFRTPARAIGAKDAAVRAWQYRTQVGQRRPAERTGAPEVRHRRELLTYVDNDNRSADIAIVLLSGLGMDGGRTFESRFLSSRHLVVIPTLRGFEAVDRRTDLSGGTLEEHCQDLQRFLTHKRFSRHSHVLMVGFSIGADAMMHTVRRHSRSFDERYGVLAADPNVNSQTTFLSKRLATARPPANVGALIKLFARISTHKVLGLSEWIAREKYLIKLAETFGTDLSYVRALAVDIVRYYDTQKPGKFVALFGEVSKTLGGRIRAVLTSPLLESVLREARFAPSPPVTFCKCSHWELTKYEVLVPLIEDTLRAMGVPDTQAVYAA